MKVEELEAIGDNFLILIAQPQRQIDKAFKEVWPMRMKKKNLEQSQKNNERLTQSPLSMNNKGAKLC